MELLKRNRLQRVLQSLRYSQFSRNLRDPLQLGQLRNLRRRLRGFRTSTHMRHLGHLDHLGPLGSLASVGTLIIFSCVILLFTEASYAKNLSNRLGIGYKNQFSQDLPAIAVQYYPGPEVGISAALGIDTQQNASKLGLMVKFHRIIFTEDNLNFYLGAGAGLLTREINSKNDSGFELSGFAGTEFFFSGLDSLGFSFEAGIGVTSLSTGVRFRTIADHPIRAGITFYL